AFLRRTSSSPPEGSCAARTGLATGPRRARPGCGPDPDHDRPGIPGATARPARLAPNAGQPDGEPALIGPRLGRRSRDPRSRPARRSPRWLGGIECLESRIALASPASYSLVGGALSGIGTTAAQTGHFATDGFGDLARIGRLPVVGIGAPGAGHPMTDGFGDLVRLVP